MEISNTQNEWVKNNSNSYTWLYQTYPFLKNFGLPVSNSVLYDFYIKDMNKRNLKPQSGVYNSYELLFGYFIENYPKQNDPNRVGGKTQLEYILENLPNAIKKTFSDIGNTTGKIFSGVSNTIIIIIVLLIIFLYIYKK